jgi:hypothetical protein
MSLFGFLGDIAGATVKVALTPVAVLKDAANVITGNETDSTERLIKEAGKDLSKSIDEIMP